MSADLVDGMEAETLNGQSVIISLDPVMVNDSNVVTADIEIDNGVIHVIDAVSLPIDEETHENPQTSNASSAPYLLMALMAAADHSCDPFDIGIYCSQRICLNVKRD